MADYRAPAALSTMKSAFAASSFAAAATARRVRHRQEPLCTKEQRKGDRTRKHWGKKSDVAACRQPVRNSLATAEASPTK